MGLGDLTPEALAAIRGEDAPVKESANTNSDAAPAKYEIDLYEEGTTPKEQIKVTQISAKSLCEFISAKLRPAFNDYRGCSFRPAANGLLEFVMFFEDHKMREGTIKNIEHIGVGSDTPLVQAYVETINMNKRGRHTMTLNKETRGYLEQFMIRPMENKGHGLQPGKIRWDDCIEEKEIGGQMNFYNMGARPQTLLLLRNLNVEAIIDNAWTSTAQKKADKEHAEKLMDKYGRKNLVIVPKYQHKLNFRGFKLVSPWGQVQFTPTPVQFGPDGAMYQANSLSLPLENYWLNIETIDTDEAEKVVPIARNAAVSGFAASIY